MCGFLKLKINMKKMLFIGLLALLVSSCGNKYEDAYKAELTYKAKKENPSEFPRLGLSELEDDFMSLYLSMTPVERERYKAYRKRQNQLSEMEREAMQVASEEARTMLNN